MNFTTTHDRSETLETERDWHAIDASEAIALLHSDVNRGLIADTIY